MPDWSNHDVNFMRHALEQAVRAKAAGEVPVGALVVVEHEIVAESHNQREERQDPTAHAEIEVIRAAAARLGTWRLSDATLYVTLEPCPMCIGAALQARLRRVVFGAYDPKAGACGSVLNLPGDRRLNHIIQIEGAILADECQVLLQQFFRDLRQKTGSSAAG